MIIDKIAYFHSDETEKSLSLSELMKKPFLVKQSKLEKWLFEESQMKQSFGSLNTYK